MSKPTKEVINRYLKKKYDILAIRIEKEELASFKKKCQEKNVSQASIIKNAINEFLAK